MKIKLNRKNKIIAGISVIFVCTVLITAGVFTLVNKAKGESSVEVLEKNKISNLFNIKQAEGDLDDDSSSSSRRSSSSSSSSSSSNTTGNTVSSGSTSSNTSSTTRKSTSKSNTKVATTTQTPSATTTSTPNVTTSTPQQPAATTTQPAATPNSSDGNSGGSTTQPSRAPAKAPAAEEPEEPAGTDETTTDVNNDGYKITINNSITGHTYEAYQIFTGTLYEKDEKKILSNIEWGDNFKSYGPTIIQTFKEDPTFGTYTDLASCQTAADLADFLSNNEGAASQFTSIIGQIIETSDPKIQPVSTTGDTYEITGLDAGYYMIVDKQIANEDDAYSKYLLDVVSNVTMEVKVIKPTLRKTVKENNIIFPEEDTRDTQKYNTATYYGEDSNEYNIIFGLEARIPTNQSETYKEKDKDFLGEYSKYEYSIIDVLDAGFDLENNDEGKLDITVKRADGTEISLDYVFEYIELTADNINNYDLKNTDITYYEGKTVFKISIPNLKGLVENGTLNPGEVITFEYNAKLNENHVIGAMPNATEAYLIYSDNPYNEESTSKTMTSPTYTYSLDLNILKIEHNNSDKLLAGANFEIYEEPELDNPIATIITDERGATSYNSLGAGKYQIKETIAPVGYNRLNENIKLDINIASIDTNNNATWNVEINDNPLVRLDDEEYANLTIANKTGAQLPITGGIGTVIFTVVGIGIMGLAVVALKSNKKED